MRWISQLDIGSACLSAIFNGEDAKFVSLDGLLVTLTELGRCECPLHDGDILATVDLAGPMGGTVLTAGEDGNVMMTGQQNAPEQLASVGRWVSCLAAQPEGAIAYASGRNVYLRDSSASLHSMQTSGPVQALAFNHQGDQLAIGLFDRLLVCQLSTLEITIEIEWKGVPTRVAFSPDDRFLIVACRDALLYGWRLDSQRRFRMLGYSRPVSAWSWSADGEWLVTDAGAQAVMWPFDGQDGPMGRVPVTLGERPTSEVSTVECHPSRHWVALGYADGLMLLQSAEGDAPKVLGRSTGGPVTCLRWHESGELLAYGTENGQCGTIAIA